MGALTVLRKSTRYSLNHSTSYIHHSILSPKTPPPSSNPLTYYAFSSSGQSSFPRFITYVSPKSNLSSILSSGYPSFSHFVTPVSSKSSLSLVSFEVSCGRRFMSEFTSSSSADSDSDLASRSGSGGGSGRGSVGVKRSGFVTSAQLSELIDVVKNNASDMESKLESSGFRLSKWCIVEILRVLNVAKVPALRFFEWVRGVYPVYSRNADICSMMVDNCGRLDDFDSMLRLLKDFRECSICLTDKAFGFLPVLRTTMEEAMNAIESVILVLDQVGGSCRNSGIHSLLELLCSLGSFDMADFVLQTTERKVAYYHVMIKHRCVRGHFRKAILLLDEMRKVKCDPESSSYNYLFGSLLKNRRIKIAYSLFGDMVKRNCLPCENTYEIFIYFNCIRRKSDHAVKFYDEMVSRGLEPRLQTHMSFLRGYFNSQQYVKAYSYIVDLAADEEWAAEWLYDSLARLHMKGGDLLIAHKLLMEMMEKDYRPTGLVYTKTLERLNKTGNKRFAKTLEAKFCSWQISQNGG